MPDHRLGTSDLTKMPTGRKRLKRPSQRIRFNWVAQWGARAMRLDIRYPRRVDIRVTIRVLKQFC